MTPTTNLGLPIYGSNDVPQWTDTNTPFQTLDDIIGQGGGSNVVPLLDFNNAIALTSTAITASKDGCVVGGMDGANGSIQVQIDGKSFNHYESDGRVPFVCIPNIPKGSSIKLNKNNTGNYVWFVPYKYQAVSPEVTVYNEAEVELNYTTPLHTFSSGNLSYTATKDCWLIGTFWSGNGDNRLSINGVDYFRGYFAPGVMITDSNISPVKLTRGDVVTVQQPCDLLHVLEGTISGSVGSVGEPVFDFANPLFTFQNSTGHKSYTADHDCWLVGYLSLSQQGNCDLSIDGTYIAHARYYNESTGVEIKYKILNGSTVTIQPTATLWETLHIFDEV